MLVVGVHLKPMDLAPMSFKQLASLPGQMKTVTVNWVMVGEKIFTTACYALGIFLIVAVMRKVLDAEIHAKEIAVALCFPKSRQRTILFLSWWAL